MNWSVPAGVRAAEAVEPTDHLSARLLPVLARETLSVLERHGYDPAIACIACTRVVIDAARYFGLRARPLVARAVCFNERARAQIEAGIEPERAVRAGGGHSVGVGWGMSGEQLGHHRGNAWIGHLVAVLEDRVLVDAALPQASRPDRGMPLRGLAVPLAQATSGWATPQGGLVLYRLFPQERSYTSTADWRRSMKQPVAELINLAKANCEPAPGEASEPGDPERAPDEWSSPTSNLVRPNAGREITP